MLRPAIIYSDDEDGVFVAIKPDEFVKLLEEYHRQHGSIKKAVEAIEFDLKQKTRYK